MEADIILKLPREEATALLIVIAKISYDDMEHLCRRAEPFPSRRHAADVAYAACAMAIRQLRDAMSVNSTS